MFLLVAYDPCLTLGKLRLVGSALASEEGLLSSKPQKEIHAEHRSYLLSSTGQM